MDIVGKGVFLSSVNLFSDGPVAVLRGEEFDEEIELLNY